MTVSTDEEFIHAFDHGHEFSKSELQDFRGGMFGKLIEVIEGRERKWDREMTTVCHIEGRYFALDWERGLTKYQDNEYPYQPYEVVKHEYEKTVKVVEWKRI